VREQSGDGDLVVVGLELDRLVELPDVLGLIREVTSDFWAAFRLADEAGVDVDHL
jgi:hypothetical protein